jgi:ISXO2-like transposase domain
LFRWFNRDSILMTDESAVYDWFGSKMRRHYRVNHSAGEYAREQDDVTAHVNTAEGFFGLFKRAIVGIHHQFRQSICIATLPSTTSATAAVAMTLRPGLRAI